jgi:outer membrane receptor protein involved in Fe transport
VSENRGVDFAAQTGLEGVTRDPRDVGYPQMSTAGLFSTMGDPTSFVYRRNEHFELYENLLLDRGAHHLKFGTYFFHLRFRPEQPDNARGAFNYTGQFSRQRVCRFSPRVSDQRGLGIGRGSEDGRTNWVHLFAQDDWRVRRNLTVNLGLRYEYNQHMHDVTNRLSSVDLDGRRFVIASDDNGTISDEARPLLSSLPLPYVTSADAGWDPGLTAPLARAACTTNGVCAFAGERACGHPRWLRHLSESVGVQRADRVRPQPSVLLYA